MYVTEGVSYNLDEDNDIHDKLLSIELTDKHKGEGGGRGVKGLRGLQDFWIYGGLWNWAPLWVLKKKWAQSLFEGRDKLYYTK